MVLELSGYQIYVVLVIRRYIRGSTVIRRYICGSRGFRRYIRGSRYQEVYTVVLVIRRYMVLVIRYTWL